MNVGNCPRCGKLYALNLRDMCINCQKEIEQEYERCVEYLRKERGATIHEVSEATGVSIQQITRFVREGRISTVEAPNMNYPCEVCGILIRESNMCESCRSRLTKEIRQVVTDSTSTDKQERSGDGAYRALDKFR
ncbi:flagellar protein [Paenibacillus lemnae]|uniref:Flagellar protein n=1 Tax=Paenibacillus lemnae TaxID=1330551 RepID=A0A848M8S4_PAELE|nr:flagellar protein [Paenibacillus lemnae]NMO96611.1 flagellar protein [Paenibacillus lemnae]